jgi:predicted ATPase
MQQTNWYVITGAPCSGKTTVICELEQRGYRVVHELARAYIEKQIDKGNSLDQIKADLWLFERHILNEKVKIETRLPAKTLIFFDRAVPDSIAYFNIASLDPREPMKKSRCCWYKKIFLFERLDFKKEPIRSEDESLAKRLDILLEQAYRQVGYEVDRVPVLSVQNRVQYVLDHL